MKRFTFLIIILLCLSASFSFTSCKSNSGKQAKTQAPTDDLLPTLPLGVIQKLFNECEAVEVTFYELPMSMSSSASNTKSFVGFIKNEGIKKSNLQKKATGIMNFNIDGDIYMDAEFYVDPNNSFTPYFRVKREGKAYYNKMSEQAAKVFTNPMRQ